MKKNILKILAAVTALLLIFFIFSIVNAFVGNPISKAIATKKIKAYVTEHYSDTKLELSMATYNFKDSNYYIKAKSKTSKDTYFMIYYNHGKVTDSYESDVLGGWNTYMRLEQEFSDRVEAIIEKHMPYSYDMIIAGLDKEAIDTSGLLPLDMEFDLHNLPMDAYVTLYIYYGKATWEDVAKVTLELEELMQDNNITVSKYSVILQPSNEEETKEKRDESVGIYDFPRELLFQDNLSSFMKSFYEDWNNHGDLEKSKEMEKVE